MNQRQFIGKAGSTALFLLASSSLFAKSKKESGREFVFIEAILFCKDTSFEPTNDIVALTKFRRELLNLPHSLMTNAYLPTTLIQCSTQN